MSMNFDEVLGASQGYTNKKVDVVQREVNTLKSIGRFLSTWSCTTGLPVSNPPSNPYTYQTGDYYRISAVAEVGGTNYKPSGTSYTGVASTTVDTTEVEVRGIYVYDGNGGWLYLPNEYADQIVDVQVNGTSIVNEQGIADIPYASIGNPGVIKIYGQYGTDIYNGLLRAGVETFGAYANSSSNMFISKGTLENVLDGYKCKYEPKTVLDATAVVGSAYYLGEQSSVAIVLPSSASAGDMISVVFYSGATAATLSISGTTIGEVITPVANERVEINMLYDGTYWAILTNEMAVTQGE